MLFRVNSFGTIHFAGGKINVAGGPGAATTSEGVASPITIEGTVCRVDGTMVVC